MTQLTRRVFYKLSPGLRLMIRKAFFFPIDIWNTITGKRHKYEPLKGDIYIGSGNFIAQGKHHLELLKEHIYLSPNDAVLDVGSGIGRTAVALTQHLNPNGKYEGFDVVEKGVSWCNKKINKDFPNFNFIYVPLKNDLYNNCKEEAQDFKFPYEDNTFNKVFLFSVFTHMTVDDISHYLSEIKRVMKPGGLCLFTCFTYNNLNEAYIAHHDPFSFPYLKDDYRLMNNKVESANIALKDVLLDKLIARAELKKLHIIPGYWAKETQKNPHNDFQDIVIVQS